MEIEEEEVELYEGKNRTEVLQGFIAPFSFSELINVDDSDNIPRDMEVRILRFMEDKGFTLPKKSWVRIVHDVAASKNPEYSSRLEAVRFARLVKEKRQAARRKEREAERTFAASSLVASTNKKAPAISSSSTLEIQTVGGEISFVICDSQTIDLENLSAADLHGFAELLQSMGHPQAVSSAVRGYSKLISTVHKASKIIACMQVLKPGLIS